MTPAERIICRFGGIRPMSALLGDIPASTIQGWRERGFIPIKRVAQVIKASQELPEPVTFEDFLPRPGDDPRVLPPAETEAA